MQPYLSAYAFNITNPKEVNFLSPKIPLLLIFKVTVGSIITKKEFLVSNYPCIVQVLNGAKPILQEVGPFVYKSETFKENIKWHDDNTMSYRPR